MGSTLERKFWPVLCCSETGQENGRVPVSRELPIAVQGTSTLSLSQGRCLPAWSVLSCQCDYSLLCTVWYPQGSSLSSPAGHVLYFKPCWVWDESQTNIMKVVLVFLNLGIRCKLFLKLLPSPLLLECHCVRTKLIATKQNTQVQKSLVMQGIIFLSLWHFRYFTT